MTGSFHTGSGNYIHRTKSGSITQQFPERGWVSPQYYGYSYRRGPTQYIQPGPLQRTPGPYRDPSNPPIYRTYSYEGIYGRFLGTPPQFVPGSGYDPLPYDDWWDGNDMLGNPDAPDASDDGWLIDPDYDYLDDPNFQQVTCGLSFCIDADGNVIE